MNYKLAIAILVAIAFVAFIVDFIYMPVKRNDTSRIEVLIGEGDNLSVIGNKLDKVGVIESRFLFIFYVRIFGKDDDLKAGRYIFSKSINIPTIVSFLVEGKSEPVDIRLLVPEGFNVWEIDERLVDLGLTKEGEFSSKYYKEEGYLFPDSYRLKPQDPQDEKRGDQLIEELRKKMKDNFNSKAESVKGLSLGELREIIIIASILEKEARTEKDMKLVSGIIKKRVELSMPLQVDATVIYGACRREAARSNFTKNCDVTFQGPAREIKIDGPFNTYTRKGLPPEPISNPGLKSIQAALNPQKSDYLYYLSTRDGSQMIYSKTPSEHVANRKKYLGI